MVKYQSTPLDDTFAALADPTRRAILAQLARGESTAGEIAEPFAMSWPAITKHVKILERAGLVTRQREGRHHYLRLEPQRLRAVSHWIEDLEAFWEGSLDRLDHYLEANQSHHSEKKKENSDDD